MSMNYNPYAAPTADARPGFAGPGALGAPQPWSPTEVLGLGWEAVKRDFPVLVFAPFMAMVIGQIPAAVNSGLVASGAISDPMVVLAVNGVFTLFGVIIGMFFQVGLIRIYVSAARGESPDFSMLFGGADRFIWVLLNQLLFGLIVGVGMVLFLVPGFIAMAGLFHSQFYVVDARMGPIEAMQASWEGTKGQKGDVFLLGVLTMLLMFAGLLALCVGYLVAMPVAYVGTAIAYLRFSGRAPAMGMPAGYGPPPGTPPGYAGGWGGAPQGGFGGPPQQGGGYPPQGGGWGGPPPQGGGWGG